VKQGLNVAQEKLAPHDIEAEEAVIGSLLIDPDAILEVAGFLEPQDFFGEAGQPIYRACLSLYQRNEVINQISVAHELMRQDRLEQIGGAAYLSHLISTVPTSLHVQHYGQIVSRTAVMRRLIGAAGQIAAIGYEAGPDIDTSLNKAEDILFRVRMRRSPRDFVSLREVLSQYFEEAGQPRTTARGKQVSHVLTGFAALDDFLGGLERPCLLYTSPSPRDRTRSRMPSSA